MAAKRPMLGVRHPTVVPTNFEEVTEDGSADEESEDR